MAKQIPAILAALATAALLTACQAAATPASQAPISTLSSTPAASLAVAQTTPSPVAPSSGPVASGTPLIIPPPIQSGPPVENPSPVGTAQPTIFAIDPCSLLSDDQVTAVNGISYGPGVAHSLTASSVECVWQSKADKASVTVQVAFWPNITDADVAYGEYLAQQNAAVEDVPGFADKAAIGRASGHGLSTGGMYVRDGSILYDIVYINGTPPTDDQLKLAATLILGQLPTM